MGDRARAALIGAAIGAAALVLRSLIIDSGLRSVSYYGGGALAGTIIGLLIHAIRNRKRSG